MSSSGTAHLRNPGLIEVSGGQVNKGPMEFPDAAVLGARHGSVRAAIRADLGSRTVRVTTDGAPYERREAALGKPGLALNDSAVLSWGEGTALTRGADEELIRKTAGRPA